MDTVVLDFLPVMLAAILAPFPILIVLLMLGRQDGLVVAICFVAGLIVVRLLQGLVFGYVFNASPEAQTDVGGKSIKDILFLILGILLLATALRSWLMSSDAKGAPPKWKTMFDSVTPGKAFVLGAVLVLIAAKAWVFTLGTISIIGTHELNTSQQITAYLIYLLGAHSLLLGMLGYAAILPAQSARVLGNALNWMEQNSKLVKIVISVGFGLYFVSKGLQGLFG